MTQEIERGKRGCKDDPQRGRPSTSTDENVEPVKEKLQQLPSYCKMIADELDMNSESVEDHYETCVQKWYQGC